MCFRILTAKLLLLSLLVPATSSIRSKDLEEDRNESASEEVKPIEESFEETSSENEFSLQSATTTEYTTTVVTYGKVTSFVASQKNVSEEFRASVPLGEIKESRINANPFDNAHRVRFENEHDPDSYREQLDNFQLVIQPTGYLGQPDHHGNRHQSFFGTVSGSSEDGKKEGAEQTAYVKFQTDPIDVPMIHYGSLKDQQFHQQVAQSIAENVGTQRDPMNQQLFQNLQKPVYEQNTPAFFQKPSKIHGETQKHELGSFASIDLPNSPYFGGPYQMDHQIHQPVSHEFGTPAPNKPINGVVYAQESTFMTTRKFPYSFYQPASAVGYHRIEFVNDDQPVYPVKRRISPWKKILHLIGAFLPFGLLLAALTPTVVKLNNTTEPNIVLSKLRVADLPVEHKQARFVQEPPTVCEERSICELISAGDEAGSSVLQNLLWNLAIRTSTTVAKENGLRDVFEAVKKKDCTKVAC